MKSFFRSSFGLQQRGYRLLFNVVALGTHSFMAWLFLASDSMNLLSPQHFIGLILMSLGSVIIFVALKGYGLMKFVGFQKEDIYENLVVSGLNRYSRHPLYVGILLALLGLVFCRPTTNAIITLTITYFYVLIGVQLEEKKLIAQFGNDYISYQQKVGMLWPRRK